MKLFRGAYHHSNLKRCDHHVASRHALLEALSHPRDDNYIAAFELNLNFKGVI